MSNILAVSINTESLLSGNMPTGTLSAEQTTEVLFSDKYFDRLYLDSNNTSVSLGGALVGRLEGSIDSILDTSFVFTATMGIVGSVKIDHDSNVLFNVLTGAIGRFSAAQETNTNFQGTRGITGSFVVENQTVVFFENKTINSVVAFGSDSLFSFSGYVGITSSINLQVSSELAFRGNNINLDTVHTFVMNSKTAGVAEYTNYVFNSFIQLNGLYYGCSPSGIYLLSGSLDNTGVIPQAIIKTALSDFNTQKMKSVRDGYAYIRSTGDMLVSVTTNEQLERNNYPIFYDGIDGIHRRRVKTAQGLRGTSWQVSIKNDSGADFTIKQVDIIPVELDRSI